MSTPQLLTHPTAPALSVTGAPVEQFWYAIYTRARHEKSVASLLRQKAVTAFLPLIAQTHHWSDRRKVVEIPLFAGYAFVRVAASAQAHLQVLQTPGVVGFVGNGRCGVPIPDKQIEDIQTVLAHRVSCAIFPFLRVGQRIRIRGGCMDGIEGRLITLKGNRTLVISIEPILQSLAISLDGYDVEILAPSDSMA